MVGWDPWVRELGLLVEVGQITGRRQAVADLICPRSLEVPRYQTGRHRSAAETHEVGEALEVLRVLLVLLPEVCEDDDGHQDHDHSGGGHHHARRLQMVE